MFIAFTTACVWQTTVRWYDDAVESRLEPGPPAAARCRLVHGRGAGRRRGALSPTLEAVRATRGPARCDEVDVGRRHASRTHRTCGTPSAWPTGPERPTAAALRRAGAGRHRRRLRHDHGPGRHPLHPPEPGADRRSRSSAPSGRRCAGEMFTETYTGTLGPSIRAVAPVSDGRTRSSALVSVGITVEAISRRAARARRCRCSRWPPLVLAVGGRRAACWSAAAAPADARRRRPRSWPGCSTTTRRCCTRSAKGWCCSTPTVGVALCNDGARELLGLAEPPRAGTPVAELGLPAELVEALTVDGPAVGRDPRDRRPGAGASARRRSARGERALGTVVTLRDHTELQALTGELDTVRGFAESLRSQAHEAANRLHTVVSLVELGRTEEAVRVRHRGAGARAAADRPGGRRGRRTGARRAAAGQVRARPASAASSWTDRRRPASTTASPARRRPADLVTMLGNLIDNAIDAACRAAGSPPTGAGHGQRRTDGELLLRVADTGRGLDPTRPSEVFRRGWSTKRPGAGRGLGLALVGQVVRRLRRHGRACTATTLGRCGVHRAAADCEPGGDRPMIRRAGRRGRADRRARRTGTTSSGCPASRSPASRTPAAEALRFLRAGAVSTWCCSTSTCPTRHGLALCRALRAAGRSGRRHRGDLGARPGRRARPAVSVGRGAVPAQAVHLRRAAGQAGALRRATGTTLAGEAPTRPRSTGRWRSAAHRRHAALPKGMSGADARRRHRGAARRAPRDCPPRRRRARSGVSRVTARRYLEYLADSGLAQRRPHYGQVGRPEVWYRSA